MNINHILFYLCCSFFLQSCGGNVDLGGGYKYIFHDDHIAYISKLDKTSAHKPYKDIIPLLVVDYDFNDNFIIASRLIVNVYECIQYDFSSKKNTSGIEMEYLRSLDYWIISKDNSVVYNTNNRLDFASKLQEKELNNLKVEVDIKKVLLKKGKHLEPFFRGGFINEDKCKKL